MYKRELFTRSILLIFFMILNYDIAYSKNKSIDTIKKSADLVDNWTLIKDSPLDFKPELTYSVWELDRPPYNELYDRIRLHRLVNTSVRAKAGIFILPATYSSAEQIFSGKFLSKVLKSAEEHKYEFPDLSNETLKDIETIPFRSLPHFLALNGYDVYSMDYRTHFVPKDLPLPSTKFMANWGVGVIYGRGGFSHKKSKRDL